MWYPLILIVFITSSEGLTKSFLADLIDSEWEDIVSAGGMQIDHGRSKRFVEFNENQPNIPHQGCLLPNGKAGLCRHFHYCIQEDYKGNFMKFLDYLCIIQHSSVGVCCPEDSFGARAGDLPATALRDENVIFLEKIQSEYQDCGLSTRAQGHVTGAMATNPSQWPWMASVTPEGRDQWCGGSLINKQHVLSAAHCTHCYKPEEIFVRLGEYDLFTTNDSRSYNFNVIDMREHEHFDKANYFNDLVILKLDRVVEFNSYVRPICLPPPGLKLENENATVIGWGTKWYGGPISPILMELSVPIWPQLKCISAFVGSIFNENLCAAGLVGEKDACQGDSGGPLMYQMPNGRWSVVGVVSWGVRCGEPEHPGIYSRVDRYLPWIQRNSNFGPGQESTYSKFCHRCVFNSDNSTSECIENKK